MLSSFISQGKYKERLKVINSQLNAKCESQRASLVERGLDLEDQVQNLTIRVAKLQRKLNNQVRQICYAKARI